MGATVSLVIQPWQKSTEVPSQPYANQETRRNLKDKLLADTIRTEDLLGASQVNPHVKTAIVSVIGSRNMGDEETGDTMDTVGLDAGWCALQGWRSGQEDAHVCDVSFDGALAEERAAARRIRRGKKEPRDARVNIGAPRAARGHVRAQARRGDAQKRG